MPQVAGRKQAGREPGWGQSQRLASLGEVATLLAVAESSMPAKMIAADSLFIIPTKYSANNPGGGPSSQAAFSVYNFSAAPLLFFGTAGLTTITFGVSSIGFSKGGVAAATGETSVRSWGSGDCPG